MKRNRLSATGYHFESISSIRPPSKVYPTIQGLSDYPAIVTGM